MVSYPFLKKFIGKKILLNIGINGNERFYTGTATDFDDKTESFLFVDKFGNMMSVNAEHVSKIEEFDPNHKKGEGKEEPKAEISEHDPNEFLQDDFLEPQKPRRNSK